MDDMTAFERQVADEIAGIVGPARSVDDLAVFDAAASRSHRWGFTMFSALKFIAAAAIVALFGGFLLVGVLTTPQGDETAPAAVTESPSPATTDELLAGMVTEEVERGVYRVVHDGVLDLPGAQEVIAGLDGSVWVFGEQTPHQLGDEQVHNWSEEGPRPYDEVEVAPDGTLWVDGTDWTEGPWEGLGAFDGEEWVRRTPPNVPENHRPWGMKVALDGAIWVLLNSQGAWVADTAILARLQDDVWEVIEAVPSEFPALHIGSGSGAWIVGDLTGDGVGDSLYRFDGSEWQPQETPEGFSGLDMIVGPNDTVWASLREQPPADGEEDICGWCRDGLARHDGSTWEEWPAERFPEQGRESLVSALQPFAVAPDGSLWGEVVWGSNVSPFSDEWTEPECDGVARIDGGTSTHYLPGLCVSSFDIAPDSSAWLTADIGDTAEIYVITLEAVAVAKSPSEAVAVAKSPSPATTDELLAGMVTEEVEPGVFRVDHDGVRDFSSADMDFVELGFPSFFVDVAPDGSVWLSGGGQSGDGLYQLGDDRNYEDGGDAWGANRHAHFAPDGTLWASGGDSVRTFTGGTWVVRHLPGLGHSDLAVGPDGDAWVVAGLEDGASVLRLAPTPDAGYSYRPFDGWASLTDGNGWPESIEVAPDGTGWLLGGWGDGWLLRYDDQGWQAVDAPTSVLRGSELRDLTAGPDGSLWLVGTRPNEVHQRGPALARLDRDGWSTFDAMEVGFGWGQGVGVFLGSYLLDVAPDGALWLNASVENAGEHAGVARFDGASWQRFLDGHTVHDLDAGPDGAVWVRAADASTEGQGAVDGAVDLYVITPEAVAATEL
jgi:hypothetical protein